MKNMANIQPQIFTQTRSAVVLADAENIDLSLKGSGDYQLARDFGSNPQHWLRSLEKKFNLNIIIRKCYLNPKSFGHNRESFLQAGFETIDCPSLTNQGKNAADIQMVLDSVDMLNHPVNIDTFIILSGDADFTPLLRRFRAYNRETIIVTAGYASRIYKSNASHVLDASIFALEEAKTTVTEEDKAAEEHDFKVVCDFIADIVENAAEPISLAKLAGFEYVQEFGKKTNWNAHGSFKNLIKSIDFEGLEFIYYKGADSLVHKTHLSDVLAEDVDNRIEAQEVIVKKIVEIVNMSPDYVPLANIGSQPDICQFGKATNWQGYGKLSAFIESLTFTDLVYSPVNEGCLYNPLRHKTPELFIATPALVDADLKQQFDEYYPQLAPLARRLHLENTMPYLLPTHYRFILLSIADYVNDNGFHSYVINSEIKERCEDAGVPASWDDVTNIIRILLRMGHKFGQDYPEDLHKLAILLHQYAVGISKTNSRPLNDKEAEELKELFGCDY